MSELSHLDSKIARPKIVLAVFVENIPAIKLYKFLGFKIESRLKEDAYFADKYHDVLLMAKFKN